MKRIRIDKILVERGFAEDEKKALALVMAGVVVANDKRVEKTSEKFQEDTKIRIKGGEKKYVSRGGLKLEKALKEFDICVDKYVCLDIGASTGGFTDCLLKKGAKRVYTVDSGTNQLNWSLRKDERVEVREQVNARYLKPDDFAEKFDLIVMDVSFISVRKILQNLPLLLAKKGKITVLIKPQFEVKREEIGDGGIVKDEKIHKKVVKEINEFAKDIGLKNLGVIDSPILGAKGNKEFLGLYERE